MNPTENTGLLVPSAPVHPAIVGVQALLAAPFDVLRLQYAGAVVFGVLQRSLIESGRLERALDTLERVVLGPLARRR